MDYPSVFLGFITIYLSSELPRFARHKQHVNRQVARRVSRRKKVVPHGSSPSNEAGSTPSFGTYDLGKCSLEIAHAQL